MIDWEAVEQRHDGAEECPLGHGYSDDGCPECAEYAEALQSAVLSAFGISIAAEECRDWLEADLTVDQAVGWMNHGCGPGDAAGCWTKDPDEAFA